MSPGEVLFVLGQSPFVGFGVRGGQDLVREENGQVIVLIPTAVGVGTLVSHPT